MVPFGFTPSNDDDESEENNPASPQPNEATEDNDAVGENQDLSALFAMLQEQMQSQFGESMPTDMTKEIQEQFAKLGINPIGFLEALGKSDSGLPLSISRDIAKQYVAAHGSAMIGTDDVAVYNEAMEIADLWLNDATVFPASSNVKNIYSRADWVDATMKGWQKTVEPLANGLAKAMTSIVEEQGLPENSLPLAQVAGLLRSFIGTMIATQLGQSIGGLAASVTGAHDVGLPLLEPAWPALIPENIALWSADIGIEPSEVRIFHALREGAIARLFDNNPWLIEYMRNAIAEYGKGIRIDVEAMQRQAEEAIDSGAIDPNNPETFKVALNEGLFTPEESPAQVEALTKLETALALIDGWADDVTTLAAADRLPSLNALRETLRRRRATSSPAQQLFASLFGLEVSPRMSRESSAFWSHIRDLRDVSIRDQIWSGILPTHEELINAEGYLRSIEVPDDLSSLTD
ncbi:MAG: zinc-dependent metalloprotease [Candidatus Nanopelagicaceae bacterium]|nr:zinc-dependent metalloprotease [Candidatus Nanopelagicaceae bacterium]